MHPSVFCLHGVTLCVSLRLYVHGLNEAHVIKQLKKEVSLLSTRALVLTLAQSILLKECR